MRPSPAITAAGCLWMAWAFSACSTLVTQHLLTGAEYPARDGDVMLYPESEEQPEDVEEVAVVLANGDWIDAGTGALLDGLRHEARSLGCDCVVRVRVDVGKDKAAASGIAGRRAGPAREKGPPGTPE